MKRFITRVFSLCLLGSTLAHANSDGSSQSIRIARSGSQPSSQGPAEHFIGSVRVNPLFQAADPARASGAYVTFAPGARTAWHTHPLGQTLIVTAGMGRVQQWGGPVEEIRPGDVVLIPPGVKHWHGAAPSASLTHIAIQEQLNGKTVDWLEQVSDEQYGKMPAPAERGPGAAARAPSVSPSAQPSQAQRLFGDIDPKLAELTDSVLFGDVWVRPQLSPRDRSLVTVSALIAMNRPEQLRSHLARALENGVTQEELVEAITHLAFYAGWPSAVTAATTAKEVFRKP
jgi:4-carboxymuconolactone decarboxylase